MSTTRDYVPQPDMILSGSLNASIGDLLKLMTDNNLNHVVMVIQNFRVCVTICPDASTAASVTEQVASILLNSHSERGDHGTN